MLYEIAEALDPWAKLFLNLNDNSYQINDEGSDKELSVATCEGSYVANLKGKASLKVEANHVLLKLKGSMSKPEVLSVRTLNVSIYHPCPARCLTFRECLECGNLQFIESGLCECSKGIFEEISSPFTCSESVATEARKELANVTIITELAQGSSDFTEDSLAQWRVVLQGSSEWKEGSSELIRQIHGRKWLGNSELLIKAERVFLLQKAHFKAEVSLEIVVENFDNDGYSPYEDPDFFRLYINGKEIRSITVQREQPLDVYGKKMENWRGLLRAAVPHSQKELTVTILANVRTPGRYWSFGNVLVEVADCLEGCNACSKWNICEDKD